MAAGTGARWQAVPADAEAMLRGDLLIPRRRYGAKVGINLGAMFAAPMPVDVISWVQGEGLLAFAQQGMRATPDAWNAFQDLVQGNSLLFAVFLN